MALIRNILKIFVHLIDILFQPRFKKRSLENQQRMDNITSELSLYQFSACPFCVKVRWACRRMGINISIKDAKNNKYVRQTLLSRGGKIKVPCLHIATDGKDEWMYESKDIIAYLKVIAESVDTVEKASPTKVSYECS